MRKDLDVAVVLRLRDQLTGELAGATSKVDATLGKLSNAGRGMTVAGAAISGAFAVGFAKASEFNTELAQVSTLVDTSTVSMAAFKDGINDLSVETGQSATSLASGLYQAISAGVETGDALEFMSTASKAAVAGATDTLTAVDGLTSVLNAYNLQSSEAATVSDAMFMAVLKGKTTFAELSASIGRVTPISSAMNVSFEDTLGLLAAMTTRGINTAEATTALRQTLIGIGAPTSQAAETAAALGIEFNQTAMEAKGLVPFLNDIVTATGGDIAQLKLLFGSVEAVNGVLAITGENAENTGQILAAMGDSTGAAAKAYEKMADEEGAAVDRMMRSLELLARSFGDAVAPSVANVAKALTPLVKAAAAFVDTPLGAVAADVAAGLGLVLGVTGPLLYALPQLAARWTIVAGWMSAKTAATVASTTADEAKIVSSTGVTAALTAETIAAEAATAGLLAHSGAGYASQWRRAPVRSAAPAAAATGAGIINPATIGLAVFAVGMKTMWNATVAPSFDQLDESLASLKDSIDAAKARGFGVTETAPLASPSTIFSEELGNFMFGWIAGDRESEASRKFRESLDTPVTRPAPKGLPSIRKRREEAVGELAALEARRDAIGSTGAIATGVESRIADLRRENIALLGQEYRQLLSQGPTVNTERLSVEKAYWVEVGKVRESATAEWTAKIARLQAEEALDAVASPGLISDAGRELTDVWMDYARALRNAGDETGAMQAATEGLTRSMETQRGEVEKSLGLQDAQLGYMKSYRDAMVAMGGESPASMRLSKQIAYRQQGVAGMQMGYARQMYAQGDQTGGLRLGAQAWGGMAGGVSDYRQRYQVGGGGGSGPPGGSTAQDYNLNISVSGEGARAFFNSPEGRAAATAWLRNQQRSDAYHGRPTP